MILSYTYLCLLAKLTGLKSSRMTRTTKKTIRIQLNKCAAVPHNKSSAKGPRGQGSCVVTVLPGPSCLVAKMANT
jgi:hypothetical protein